MAASVGLHRGRDHRLPTPLRARRRGRGRGASRARQGAAFSADQAHRAADAGGRDAADDAGHVLWRVRVSYRRPVRRSGATERLPKPLRLPYGRDRRVGYRRADLARACRSDDSVHHPQGGVQQAAEARALARLRR